MARPRARWPRFSNVLIDPHVRPLLSVPENAGELISTSVDRWVLAYDDVTATPGWFAKTLCDLARGQQIASCPAQPDRAPSPPLGGRPVGRWHRGSRRASRSDPGLYRCIYSQFSSTTATAGGRILEVVSRRSFTDSGRPSRPTRRGALSRTGRAATGLNGRLMRATPEIARQNPQSGGGTSVLNPPGHRRS